MTDYTVYQDLVIVDTIVYLVSDKGLLVRTTTHKTVSLSLYLRCYFIKKKKELKKNLADLVPACWVVFTLL